MHTHTITTTNVSPRVGRVRVGWNPRWLMCQNHVTAPWLRLKNLSNCIPRPSYTYIRWLWILFILWMGMYMHTNTITTTNVSPDLGKLAEILNDGRVKTISLRLCGWGCRTFQTASHIHLMHILGVWETVYYAVDGYVDTPAHHYHHIHFPNLWE
jgi:hypothetical protein